MSQSPVISPNYIANKAINNQTGILYTLNINDADNIVTMNNVSANTITVPLNANVAYPIGTTVEVIMIGTGITTIVGVAGVTVNSSAGLAFVSQYTSVSLTKLAVNTWAALW